MPSNESWFCFDPYVLETNQINESPWYVTVINEAVRSVFTLVTFRNTEMNHTSVL